MNQCPFSLFREFKCPVARFSVTCLRENVSGDLGAGPGAPVPHILGKLKKKWQKGEKPPGQVNDPPPPPPLSSRSRSATERGLSADDLHPLHTYDSVMENDDSTNQVRAVASGCNANTNLLIVTFGANFSFTVNWSKIRAKQTSRIFRVPKLSSEISRRLAFSGPPEFSKLKKQDLSWTTRPIFSP